jgi:hypothetical protein
MEFCFWLEEGYSTDSIFANFGVDFRRDREWKMIVEVCYSMLYFTKIFLKR